MGGAYPVRHLRRALRRALRVIILEQRQYSGASHMRFLCNVYPYTCPSPVPPPASVLPCQTSGWSGCGCHVPGAVHGSEYYPDCCGL